LQIASIQVKVDDPEACSRTQSLVTAEQSGRHPRRQRERVAPSDYHSVARRQREHERLRHWVRLIHALLARTTRRKEDVRAAGSPRRSGCGGQAAGLGSSPDGRSCYSCRRIAILAVKPIISRPAGSPGGRLTFASAVPANRPGRAFHGRYFCARRQLKLFADR
jgi:hypothetical protein